MAAGNLLHSKMQREQIFFSRQNFKIFSLIIVEAKCFWEQSIKTKKP